MSDQVGAVDSVFTTTLQTSGNAAYGGVAPDAEITDILHEILSAVFSILSIIFLCLTIYAGILWMTAAGDPKKVTKAKDILGQSLTGLVICLLAYGITYWVFTWALVVA